MRKTNEIRDNGDGTATVMLSYKGQAFEATIDAADAEAVRARPWKILNNRHGHLYAATATPKNGRIDGTLLMHRMLLDPAPGLHVDHINHNTLDNRRSNLRAVHPRLNSFNRKGADRDSVTGHRNVQFRADCRLPYEVRVRHEGKPRFFGRFATIGEAVSRAEEAREIARLAMEREVAAA